MRLFFSASKKNKSGFTIIEVMVAVFIVSLSLVGILALVDSNLKVQNLNKNTLIASQLAQEGLETVRNIRERNWLDGNSFFFNIHSGGLGEEFYVIDLYNGQMAMNAVSDIDQAETKILNCSSFYYNNVSCVGTDTIFRRMITTRYLAADSKVLVTCEVQWQERNGTKSYKTNGELYDWY